MSCLILSDLSLSDQIAIELACAEKLKALTRALLAPFGLADANVFPWAAASPDVGGTNPFPNAEETAMVEQQVHDHPPLQVCFPGHRPSMFRLVGNRTVVFYVECAACGVQTPRMSTPESAADHWARRDVVSVRALAVA